MATVRLNTQGWCVLFLGTLALFLYWRSSYDPIGHMSGEVISLRGLLVRCIYLSEKAGEAIKAVHRAKTLQATWKLGSAGLKKEPLTQADIVSHNTIVSGLRSAITGIQIRSEERDGRLNVTKHSFFDNTHHLDFLKELPNADMFLPASELVVWVDPLDGTQEFTENLIDYVAVMICVAFRGRPIIGVVHQPFVNTTYWSWRDYAMSSSLKELSKQLSRKSGVSSKNLTVVVSRSHLSDKHRVVLNQMFAPIQPRFNFAGGSGFKVLSLLKGEADLYLHPASSRRWDTCAPQAVLEAAGGRITSLDGSQLTYSSSADPVLPSNLGLFAASRVELHKKWQKQLTKKWLTERSRFTL